MKKRKLYFVFSILMTGFLLGADQPQYGDLLKGLTASQAWDAIPSIYANGAVQIADSEEFRLFKAAHQNSFDNPNIENANNFGVLANEFDHNRLKPQLRKYDKIKYVTMPWPYFGSYDFKKQCMPMVGPYDMQQGIFTRPHINDNLFVMYQDYYKDYPVGYPRLSKQLCLKVPPELAQSYFDIDSLKIREPITAPIILFKIRAETYKPYKCKLVEDAEVRLECIKNKWEATRAKRFVLEPLKYSVATGGKIFQN